MLFTDEQRAWLDLIRDQIATRVTVEPDDFYYAPFRPRSGLGKAHALFGAGLANLLEELNEVLVG